MKKNDLLMLIVFSLMCTSGIASANSSVPIQESINPDFAAYSTIQAQNIDMLSNGEETTGHLPDTVDFSYIESSTSAFTSDTYVSYYDLRTQGKVTSVKDQGSCGSCWAFASYGSLESTLMPGQNHDLSEQNLKNLHGFDVGPCSGGNAQMATAYLSRWEGPVMESKDPYDPSNVYSPLSNAVKHVQEVIFLPTRKSSLDNNAIKWALQQYGAVYASMIWSDTSYNSNNYSYYYTGSSTTGGHGVTIVGWDDNFDSKKFSPAASGNGAFIVKNSWSDSWGEDGYFYISYYDSSFAKRNVNAVFTAEEVNNYDNIYQHDPLGWTSSVGYGDTVVWGANVYTASSDEILEATSFYTTSSGVSYEVFVYTDPVSGPLGELKSSVSGSFAYPGYHTVVLDDNVSLNSGQKFSVVVKLSTSGYGYPLAMETPLPYLYSSTATSNSDESYIGENGHAWEDITSTFTDANLCIKAFTSDAVPMPVMNLDTGKTYFNISAAVQDPLTLKGHTILIDSVTLQDNVRVNKELTIRSFTGDPNDTVVKALNPEGHVFYVTASNVSISGFNVTGSLSNKGIYFDGVQAGSVYDNIVDSNNYGIYVRSSVNVDIAHNQVIGNNAGILLSGSSNCNISDNIVCTNTGQGVYLLGSSACIVTNNTLNSNTQGVRLDDSVDTSITNNDISSSTYGILLLSSSSLDSMSSEVVRDDQKAGAIELSNEASLESDMKLMKLDGISPRSTYGNVLDGNMIRFNIYGVLSKYSVYNTIVNNSLYSNDQGIYFIDCSFSAIQNNTLDSNKLQGIYMLTSDDNLVKNNHLTQNKAGIRLESSNSNVLDKNIVRSNSYGLLLQSAGENTISNNTVSSNNQGIYLINSSFSTITANVISGNSLQGIYLLTSRNNILEYNQVLQSKQGIRFQSSNENIVDGNHLQSNVYGVFLLSSSNNSILTNVAKENEMGIVLSLSNRNLLVDNEACNSTSSGIYLDSSGYNDLVSNQIVYNKYGMRLYKSTLNTLEDNDLTYNKYGYLAQSAGNNMLKTNNVSLNEWYGVYLQSSGSNRIYDNMFNNAKNVVDDGSNTWNTTKTMGTNIAGGSYIGGNVWASPKGTGFSQTATDADKDGICDKKYNATGSSFDYLPLYFK